MAVGRWRSVVCLGLVSLLASVAMSRWVQSATADTGPVIEIPVEFDVINSNESDFPCLSDGAAYAVKGHLVGPEADLVGGSAQVVTVLLTGMDEGEWTWRFQDVEGYDYAFEMAKLGHTSLSLDMLGYGQSGKPHGQLSCFGSQADVNHQIVQQLRDGSYEVLTSGVDPVEFSTVLVSGHDVGALPALIQAYSWPDDVDGISTQIWAHQGATPYILRIVARRAADCARGGMEADDEPDDPDDPLDDPSRGGGYILFGPRNEEFGSDLFNEDRTDPDVIEAVLGLRNRNPCGYVTSVSAAVRVNLVRIQEIEAPVLLVFPGPEDPPSSRAATRTRKRPTSRRATMSRVPGWTPATS